MTKQAGYSTLWGYDAKCATKDFSPFQTDEDARGFRDALAKEFKKKGVKVRRSTLRNQTRQYWAWGIPCNKSCNVYKLEIIE